MFRKLRITGKLKRGLLFFIITVILFSSFGFEAFAAKADRFDDVDPGAWYYESVALAVDAGLFAGTSTFHFQPEKTITRAGFLSSLANLCKVDTSTYKNEPFSDITSSHWAYHDIAWAYTVGISKGTGNNLFLPNRNITRQEMCVMLVGAIEKVLKKSLPTTGSVVFSDYGSIATWARPAVKKCAYGGLISGYNGAFNPKGNATRAAVATVLAGYYKKNRSTPLLEVKGFYIDFKANQYYYTCPNADFDDCRILKYNGSGSITNLQVEQYLTGVTPYSATAYKLGEKLKLGFVRAKVTFKIGSKSYTLMLTDPEDNNYARALARVTGESVNVRKGPSTSYASVAKLSKNSWVYFYEKTGNWYRIKVAATGQVGYMSADYLQIGYYNEVAMPASYKTKINALKKDHPNWTFSFVDVEMTYEEALSTYGAANADYINPVKYLDETNIFAFLDVSSYQEGDWTAEQIRAMWEKGDNLAASSVTTEQFITQAMTTAKSALMNPLYMASRAILESSYGKSDFAKGMRKVTNVTINDVFYDKDLGQYYDLGATYYNFYGIGARNNNPRYAMYKAMTEGWNTKERALIEGAAWIKQEYLDWGDLTPYFMRFVFKTQYAYMTDVKAPRSEASILKRAFSDPKAKAHFIVPVYR